MNVVSPDARPPYLLTTSGTVNVNSGDAGAGVAQGMDLVIYTSGRNISGNVTVAQFMSQWFGTSGDHTGSVSGVLLSFKPYEGGYSWKTYYVPDASGLVAANDNNANYFIPLNGMKARHEYGWDALRKLTRQQHAQDNTGNKVAFEQYCDVSGAIHIFASGSYEIVASGSVLVYYAAGTSGSANNNIISAKVPYDLTALKNVIEGWFPNWQVYPYDSDAWSDFLAYSGGAWSGINPQAVNSGSPTNISGTNPAPNGIGFISIAAQASGAVSGGGVDTALIFTSSGAPFNLQKVNVSGTATAVSLNYFTRAILSGAATNSIGYHFVTIYDLSGNSIVKSGLTGGNNIVFTFSGGNADTGWVSRSHVIYTASGTFLSGTGLDGKWFALSGFFPDLKNIFQIQIDALYTLAPGLPVATHFIDQLNFSFSYPFSPVTAFNSGSQGAYGRRYGVIEWPDQISDGYASGLMTAEIQARMGSQGIAEFVVRDNFNQNPISAQLNIRPGKIFVVDAPNLSTGSGQVFNLWRASKVKHIWSKTQGFETTINAYPFYSGVGFSGTPNNNQINYQTPLTYSQVVPTAEREQYLPIGRPWNLPAPGR